ncbi:efflux RND transporter periplasmic adaptor subunit [bacterium]|nr:MAG: efflux RND transporter periplasmic adaptor subunit [bacterium]
MRRFLFGFTFLGIGLAAGVVTMVFYAKLRPKEDGTVTRVAEHKKTDKKILFYRHPMNPQVLSTEPKKDEMGMDYVPVYAGGGQAPPLNDSRQVINEPSGIVRLTPEKMQRVGVKSEEARERTLKRVIRTIGRVEPVEDLVYNINTKISGWVEKLYVNRTDLMVRQGEPLLELYSPDLVTAQEEYLLARRSFEKVKDTTYPDVKNNAESLVEASRKRLKFWDISDDQIKRLAETGKPTRTLAIKAPAHGSVTEKMVVEGQKIEPGETLFRIIDHAKVWVYGEIYENELSYIKIGDEAVMSPSYAPQEVYKGKIEHIYSHLGSVRYEQGKETEVRTAKVRFELPNSGGRLKLGMYLNVELSAVAVSKALSVPDSAVIDSGKAQFVIIDRKDGSFEPRAVAIGVKSEGYYEIKSGLKKGDMVVTSANFLIDSESNLKAALGAMVAPQSNVLTPAEATARPPAKAHAH